MKKQDRTYSRTPEDLERKYNLGKLSQGGNSKEIEELRNEVSKLNESLKSELKAWTPININGVSGRCMYMKTHNTIKIWLAFTIPTALASGSTLTICNDLLNTFGAKSSFICDGHLIIDNSVGMRIMANDNTLIIKNSATSSVPTNIGVTGFIEYPYIK